MDENKMKPSIIKDALMLFIITLVSALLLGLVNEVTKGPIEEQAKKAKAKAYFSVFEAADVIDTEDSAVNAKVDASKKLFEEADIAKVAVEEAGIVKDKSGEVIGYVMTVSTTSGYGNQPIVLTMGITKDRKITKIELISHEESPGYGANAEKPEYRNQFNALAADQLVHAKGDSGEGAEIDGISGATVTSYAMIDVVNAGIIFGNDLLGFAVGSGDDSNAYEEVFAEAVEFDVEDADILAKVSASEALLSAASISNITIDEAAVAKDEAGNPLGYVMTISTTEGYGGTITLVMGYTPDSKVTGISFVRLKETKGFGANADKPEYKDQYIGVSGENPLKMPGESGDGVEIDAITEATVSSTAILDAVNAGIVFANDLLADGVGGVQ